MLIVERCICEALRLYGRSSRKRDIRLGSRGSCVIADNGGLVFGTETTKMANYSSVTICFDQVDAVCLGLGELRLRVRVYSAQ